MASNMIEERFLVEKNGCVRLVDGVAFIDAEDAAVLDVVYPSGLDVTLLEEANPEIDAASGEIAPFFERSVSVCAPNKRENLYCKPTFIVDIGLNFFKIQLIQATCTPGNRGGRSETLV